MTFNTLDLFILGAIGVSGLFGLFRGFTASVLSLFTWIVALWLPFKFTPAFSELLPDTVVSPTARTVVAASVLFFGAFIMLSIISWLLRKLLGVTGLGFADRFLGVGLGLVRGFLIVAFLAMLASHSSSLPKEKWWADSALLPSVLRGSKIIRAQMPENLSSLFALNRL